MIDINTLRFAVQLNKLDNSQLPASPLVVEDLLDRIEKAAKEHAALRAKLSTEKGWIEDYKKQIVSLQNRLEASEHECTEQARLNGMGASREAALMAKLEAAEKERDALRAKITEMEKQDPVGWIYTVNGGWDCYSPMKPTKDAYDTGSLMPRYALPGAQTQPAPGIPEGWKLVPIEPTEKMINEGTCASTLPGPRYIDSACAKQCWTNMLAAAPEANQ